MGCGSLCSSCLLQLPGKGSEQQLCCELALTLGLLWEEVPSLSQAPVVGAQERGASWAWGPPGGVEGIPWVGLFRGRGTHGARLAACEASRVRGYHVVSKPSPGPVLAPCLDPGLCWLAGPVDDPLVPVRRASASSTHGPCQAVSQGVAAKPEFNPGGGVCPLAPLPCSPLLCSRAEREGAEVWVVRVCLLLTVQRALARAQAWPPAL